jgi:hypothetical protein
MLLKAVMQSLQTCCMLKRPRSIILPASNPAQLQGMALTHVLLLLLTAAGAEGPKGDAGATGPQGPKGKLKLC